MSNYTQGEFKYSIGWENYSGDQVDGNITFKLKHNNEIYYIWESPYTIDADITGGTGSGYIDIDENFYVPDEYLVEIYVKGELKDSKVYQYESSI